MVSVLGAIVEAARYEIQVTFTMKNRRLINITF
jgi:hypothetical protein